MKIGWDLFSFDPPGANYGVGPGLVVWRLLPELVKAAPNIQFVAFANRENRHLIPSAPNVQVVVSPCNNRKRLLRIWHEQMWLPRQVHRHKLDLLHCFGNNIPWRVADKSLLMVHDLMWHYYLQHHSRELKWRYFQWTVPRSLRLANGVVAVSKATMHQLVHLGIPAGKIQVIYNGSGNSWEEPTGQVAASLQARFPDPFIFTLTTSMPHKNLHRLLVAFRHLKQEHAIQGKLVIAGQLKGNYHKATFNYLKEHNLTEAVEVMGFVEEAEKTWLYRHARLVVYPSLYEGFGLPVLEALEAGVPVVASRVASIPEVGGDACYYVDPFDTEEMADAMYHLWHDEGVREALIQNGRLQAANFSWEKAAQETLAYYAELLKTQRLPAG